MSRMFDTHIVRDTKSLDGMWKFKMDGVDKNYTLPVPGCWEQHPDFMNHQGTGKYKKTVYVKKAGNIRLEFKGVSHTADVYFDGEKIAHHYNAFTPFSAIIKNVSAGEHELTVDVDNRFAEESSLHIPNDYYIYGGITRPVVMEYLSDAYIKYVHFTPEFDGKWKGTTEVSIVNISDEEKSLKLTTTLAGKTYSEQVTVPAGSEKIVNFTGEYDGVTPWSDKTPEFYYINTTISVTG